MPFSNELTDAQAERLAILLEELGEAQQSIGKILRHGYESSNPTVIGAETNRAALEKELGDVHLATQLLIEAGDMTANGMLTFAKLKRAKILPYLHHQNEFVARGTTQKE